MDKITATYKPPPPPPNEGFIVLQLSESAAKDLMRVVPSIAASSPESRSVLRHVKEAIRSTLTQKDTGTRCESSCPCGGRCSC